MRPQLITAVLLCVLAGSTWASPPDGFAFSETLIQLQPGTPQEVSLLAVGAGSIDGMFLGLETISPFEIAAWSVLGTAMSPPSNPQQAQVSLIIELPIPIVDGADLAQITLLAPTGTAVGTTGWLTTEGPNLSPSGYSGPATIQAMANLVVIPEPAGLFLLMPAALLLGRTRRGCRVR